MNRPSVENAHSHRVSNDPTVDSVLLTLAEVLWEIAAGMTCDGGETDHQGTNENMTNQVELTTGKTESD